MEHNDDFAPTPTRKNSPSETDMDITCPICSRNLKHLTLERRDQHVNRCLNSQQLNVNVHNAQKTYESTIDCPLCLKSVAAGPHRVTHYKQCAKTHNVSMAEMNKLVENSEKASAIRKRSNIPHTRAPVPSPSEIKTSFEKKVNRRPAGMPKDLNEEQLQIALALSKSENFTESAFEDVAKASATTSTSKKSFKQSTLPTLLESTNAEKQQKLLRDRLSEIVSSASKSTTDVKSESGPSQASTISSTAEQSRWWGAQTTTEFTAEYYRTSSLRSLTDSEATEEQQVQPKHSPTESKETFPKQKEHFVQNFHDDFMNLCLRPELADTYFIVRNRDGTQSKLPVHLFLLRVRSPNVLQDIDTENTLDLTQFYRETVETLLRFIYGAELPTVVADDELERLASGFRLDAFAEYCSRIRNQSIFQVEKEISTNSAAKVDSGIPEFSCGSDKPDDIVDTTTDSNSPERKKFKLSGNPLLQIEHHDETIPDPVGPDSHLEDFVMTSRYNCQEQPSLLIKDVWRPVLMQVELLKSQGITVANTDIISENFAPYYYAIGANPELLDDSEVSEDNIEAYGANVNGFGTNTEDFGADNDATETVEASVADADVNEISDDTLDESNSNPADTQASSRTPSKQANRKVRKRVSCPPRQSARLKRLTVKKYGVQEIVLSDSDSDNDCKDAHDKSDP